MKSWIRFCGKKEQSQKSIVVRNRTHLEKLRGDEAVNFSSLLNVNLKKTDKEIKYAIIIILIIYFCCCSLTPNATLRETPCNQTRKNHQHHQRENTTKIKRTFLQTWKTTTHPKEAKQWAPVTTTTTTQKKT